MEERKPDTCDRCQKTEDGIDWFAAAYRKVELRNGRADPGRLCGFCAGADTGKRNMLQEH